MRARVASLPDDQQPAITDIGHGLYAVYLMDDGTQFVYAQQQHLAPFKGQVQGLHEIGLMNLAKLAQAKLHMVHDGAIHGLLLDGQFEASLMLLDELWDQSLAPHTPNGAIVALPARDVLAFCDAKSLQGIVELKQLVRRITPKGEHLLTEILYYRLNGQWLPLE
jgi:uncharacterized protein YtpQ (UPF0354 family)